MLRICTILTFALIATMACESWEAIETDIKPRGPDQIDTPWKAEFMMVRGHYVRGFETSYFYPCGSDERWWVTGNERLIQAYSDIATGINELVYVRFNGNIGASGIPGQVGAADKSFHVSSVIEMRKKTDNDCN